MPNHGFIASRISPAFVKLAELGESERSLPKCQQRRPGADYDRLLDLIPFDYAYVTYGRNRRGPYVLINADEARYVGKPLRRTEAEDKPPWD